MDRKAEEMQSFGAAEQALIDVWEGNQATVLLQLGILEDDLPALGAGQADRLLDPEAPANALIRRLS